MLATVPGPDLEGATTSGRSTWSTSRTRTAWSSREYVTIEDGTGLVHMAPAFGADDLAVGRAKGCRWSTRSARTGAFTDGVPRSCGVFVKDADAGAHRRTCGSAVCCSGASRFEHTYPHCWRCHTAAALLRAPAWYIRTTAVKDQLLRGERERSTGIRTTSSRAATATGWRTTSTGRCRASATGARRCRSGAARRTTRPASARCAELGAAGRAGRLRAGSAPPVHRRGHLPVPRVRRRGAPGSRR